MISCIEGRILRGRTEYTVGEKLWLEKGRTKVEPERTQLRALFKKHRFYWESGAPGGTRTPDLLVRSQTLYPTELRARRYQLLYFTLLTLLLQLPAPLHFWSTLEQVHQTQRRLTPLPEASVRVLHPSGSTVPTWFAACAPSRSY